MPQDQQIYNNVAGLMPGKSAFDLSHRKVFDCDMGVLIPFLTEDCVPGDVFEMGVRALIRVQPLISPIFHRVKVYFHYFFCPYRIVWDDWETFITGGSDGTKTVTLHRPFDDIIDTQGDCHVKRYDLWDYFGFPIHDPSNGDQLDDMSLGVHPPINDFLWRAYWDIWATYYRDQNVQTQYPNTSIDVGENETERLTNLETFLDQEYTATNIYARCDQPAYRCWKKDYFTSALPWQQRGTSPTIPISGTTSAEWDSTLFQSTNPTAGVNLQAENDNATSAELYVGGANVNAKTNMENFFNDNSVAFTATGVDIADLRLAVQQQKWLERNARAGARYSEFVRSHFGVTPGDSRLQRPEYIGGSADDIIISEVLKLSQDGTDPQGNMAGHGLSAQSGFAGRYRVPEHGVIMGIMSICPDALYQQGIDRQWSRDNKYDFYFPEFAHLAEQEILKRELYYSKNTIGSGGTDEEVFGYQAAWDEYRIRRSKVMGKMATDLDHWHLSRIFSSAPALNESFLTLEQHSLNRRDAWAVTGVQNDEQGQFLVDLVNDVKAIRPLPYISDPGQLDHF